MKSTSLFKIIMVLATLVGFYGIAPTTARADGPHPGVWDSRHHYRRDNYGYWNDQDRYQKYVFWHNHHGYWDDKGGIRVFINVD
jgi:hypothetical protein